MNINIRDTKFLNYNIRSCVIDDVDMYLVSDLLRQYNEINNTNKQFKYYLENKQTQELLRFYSETLATSYQSICKLSKICSIKSSSHTLQSISIFVCKSPSLSAINLTLQAFPNIFLINLIL